MLNRDLAVHVLVDVNGSQTHAPLSENVNEVVSNAPERLPFTPPRSRSNSIARTGNVWHVTK